MGFRTVVILNNDFSNEWGNDPELGKKIQEAAMSRLCGDKNPTGEFRTGAVVQTVHADTQSVLIFDGLSASSKAHTRWNNTQTIEQRDLALLKEFAAKMGYNISKKPNRNGI